MQPHLLPKKTTTISAFLSRILFAVAVGILVSMPPFLLAEESSCAEHEDPLVESAVTAMLTMQRLSWEHAVAAQALYELERIDLAGLMAKEAALRQLPTGAYTNGSPTDVCAIGEVLVRMGRALEDKSLLTAMSKNRDFMARTLRRAPDGTLYHTNKGREIWIDSMYMAPPILAAMGDYDDAIRNVRGIHRRLWDPKAKLFHHQWDEDKQAIKQARLWSVGNGWALMGMLRTAAMLPPEYEADKQEIIGYFKSALDGWLVHLRDDSLTHFILDDPDTFVDSGAPCTLAYAIYRGIQYGWLPKDKYWNQAEGIRTAVRNKVDADGFLQDACGLPGYQTQSRSVETQAFFMLMEAARKAVK